MRIILILFVFSLSARATDVFRTEAAQLTHSLKSTLVSELQQKIVTSGHEEAVGFCQINVKPIAKKAVGEYAKKYRYGRTSHKVRSAGNTAEDWMVPYLENFKPLKAHDKLAAPIVHMFRDGKRAYLEPLFVQPMCLACHGTNVSRGVKSKLSAQYPNDQAVGFKVGDFRGFIWIREN